MGYGGQPLAPITRTLGPLTITAVVRRTNGGTRTVSATAMGDRVSGLRSECWTAPTDAFPPIGATCDATRTPDNDVYIVVVGETTNNSEFTVGGRQPLGMSRYGFRGPDLLTASAVRPGASS
jgi:hypothetical protein